MQSVLEHAENFKEDNSGEFRAFPRPYVIGKVVSDDEIVVASTDKLRVVVSCVE